MVAWISWIFACVSLMDASRAATRALAFLSAGDGFSYSSCGDLLRRVQPGRSPLLALLLPLVGPGLVELGLVLE